VLNAWLGGLLGGNADPKTYPKLDDLLEPKAETSETDDPRSNARMWGVWLRAENSRAGVVQD